ncbi:MAG: tRNA (N6-isopentenyl adenosine(37)-C2)-methylthiotransferase MiaB, partial [Succinivibrio sp.]
MTITSTFSNDFKLQLGSFYVEVWGCQMNVYDGGRIKDLMTAAGYLQVSSPKDADVVILVTCAVRAKAEDKV